MRVRVGTGPRHLARVLVVLWVGCGDDGEPTDTGSVDAAVDAPMDTGPLVQAPEPAAPPMLTPCPEGWAEVEATEASPTYCDPFPAPPPGDCPPGQAVFVGEEGCAEIGPPCPADGWPVDLPTTSAVLYVRPGATPGGDGSRASPFTSLADAIEAAPSTATIALAAGTHAGGVTVDGKDLAFVGACTESIVQTDEREPAMTLRRTTSSLTAMRIVGGTQGLSISEATVSLTSVNLASGAMHQLASLSILTGSTVTADSVVIRGPVDDGFALTSSSLTARRTTIVGATQTGLNITSSTVEAHDFALLRYGLPTATGIGIFGNGDTVIRLERATIAEGFGEPLLCADGSDCSLLDAHISGPPRDQPAPLSGLGSIGPAGALTLERVYAAELRGGAVVAAVETRLTARDLIVVDSLPDGADPGHGIEVAAGTTATLERVYIARATVLGILADGADTSIDASDLTIVETAPNTVGTFGRALQVQNQATMTLRRGDLRDNLEAGIVVSTAGASLDAESLSITGTDQRRCSAEGGACATGGVGIGLYEGGGATLTRFRIAESFLAGIQLASGGELDLSEGTVESNPVGANVQVPGYDLGRLMSRVVYRDNGVNLDAEELPLPDPEVTRP